MEGAGEGAQQPPRATYVNPVSDAAGDTAPSSSSWSTDKDFCSSIVLEGISQGDEESTDSMCDALGRSTLVTFAVRPDAPARLAWDLVMLLFVLYSVLAEPFRVAFDFRRELSAFDMLVDLLFYVDILMNFHTGFDRGFTVELGKRKIAKHYLRTWFVVDVIATVQWDSVVELLRPWSWVQDDNNESEGSLHVRMLRLLKVLRLARADRLIQRLTAKMSVHTDYIDAFKFFVYVSVVCHLLACFFFLWPLIMACPMDELVADAAFASPSASTQGWHWHETCMQGSWRQYYNLETICDGDGRQFKAGTPSADLQLRVCQETMELDLQAGLTHRWRQRAGVSVTSLCTAWDRAGGGGGGTCPYNRSFVAPDVVRGCGLCLGSEQLYTDALYWSLTTMTTIGYGDRGPQTSSELQFVLFAELFGLAIFALLLQQIKTIHDTMGARTAVRNDRKNALVSFLDANHCDTFDPALTKDVLHFLSFQATVLSGNSFDVSSPTFDGLPPRLSERIHIAVNRPVLEKVRMFGWNPVDFAEEESLRALFESIDTAKDGALDRDEVAALFVAKHIALTPAQFEQCFAEMDVSGSGSVNFKDFRRWWCLTKYGRPRMEKCPEQLLNSLATRLRTAAFAPGDTLVAAGQYGRHLTIMLTGSCQIRGELGSWSGSGRVADRREEPSASRLRDSLRGSLRSSLQRFGSDDEAQSPRGSPSSPKKGGGSFEVDAEVSTVTASDPEPVFGLQACLPKQHWKSAVRRTADWTVTGVSFTDTAWVERKDILACFQIWPEGMEAASRAFPSWNRSILTDIYLCHACSDHKIEDGHARTGARDLQASLPRGAPPAS